VLGIRNPLTSLALALTDVDFETTPHDHVTALLRSAHLDADELEALAPFDTTRYTRHLLFRNEAFELLVLHWPDGSASAIHDHGNQHCYMAVTSGLLVIDDFVVVSGGKEPGFAKIASAGTTIMPAGNIDIRTSARDLHRVTASGGAAVSIHVYAKPIDHFLLFEPASNSCRTVVSRYDSLPADLTNDDRPQMQVSR